jgi:Protein of unknown function (DUF3551)
MRKTVILAAIAALLLLNSERARAYDGPWCAIISLGGGFVSENCSMPSFEVCRAEALRFGPTSFCRVNGYYLAKKGEAQRYRPKKAKRKHRAAQ